jgi:exonuclease VII small subunit
MASLLEMTTLELDEKTCQFFERGSALRKQIEAELQGAFNLLIIQNSLDGQWELDLANKQLVKRDAQSQHT